MTIQDVDQLIDESIDWINAQTKIDEKEIELSVQDLLRLKNESILKLIMPDGEKIKVPIAAEKNLLESQIKRFSTQIEKYAHKFKIEIPEKIKNKVLLLMAL